MPDPTQLPHLLRLIDDSSEVVQQSVAEAFEAWGADLGAALDAMDTPPDEAQRALIDHRIMTLTLHRFLEHIPDWAEIPDDDLRLEAGLAEIATFIGGADAGAALAPRLDALSDAYRETDPPHDPLALAHFLFTVRGLAGEREDYYAPHNSNLVHVIDHGTGIPISLACIYLLVGRRLGYEVFGCNWPGHFLALAAVDGETFVIDGFNAAQTIPIETFLNMQGPSRRAAEPLLLERATPESILLRVLGNLAHAYRAAGDAARHRAASQLRDTVASRFSATA